MDKPEYLYKYTPFNIYSITNLKNQQIYFNVPANFNDPFDCAIFLNYDPISEEEYLDIYNHYLAKMSYPDKIVFQNKYIFGDKVNDQFKNGVNKGIKDSFELMIKTNRSQKGLCCFSEKKDDVLMWSHYAYGHKGFCLEFSTTFEPFSKAIQVDYDDNLPTISPAKVILEKEDYAFIIMIRRKFKCWKYEKEWRLLHLEGGNRLYYFPKESLVGIYFGSEMLYAHKEIISLIIRGQYPEVKLYEMKRGKQEFKLLPEQFNYKKESDA